MNVPKISLFTQTQAQAPSIQPVVHYLAAFASLASLVLGSYHCHNLQSQASVTSSTEQGKKKQFSIEMVKFKNGAESHL